MKKTFKAILAFLLSIIIFSGTLPMSVFAEEVQKHDYVAYVWQANKVNDGEYFKNIEDAWSKACSWGHILIMKDWKTEKVLTVPEDKKISVYMDGHVIDRGLTSSKDSGEVFLLREDSTLTVYGGSEADVEASSDKAKITGGYNGDGGGGIHVQKNATVYLYGVSVSGNKSSGGDGGGGVRLQGDYSSLIMNSSASISGNEATKGSGGGISVRGENVRIVGGKVNGNKTSKDGGGISVHSSGCVISGVTVSKNEIGEGKKGAGIYMAQGCGASVSGCLISENNANSGKGGGIYVDGNGGSLSYSIIEKNKASLGGGVYIDTGDALSLSGDLVIRGNFNSSGVADTYSNLYLAASSSKEAYIIGTPSSGEVRVSWDTEHRTENNFKISRDSGAYSARFIFSDVDGYYIYWSQSTSDGINDRYLRASKTNFKTELPHDHTDVSAGERYKVITLGYKGKYDLQEGVFTHKGAQTDSIDGVYYYSDGYFADEPSVYNDSLATMSMSVAVASFNALRDDFDEDMHNGGYANRFRNIKMLLSDIGFADADIQVSESYTQKPEKDSIGSIIAAKEIILDGNSYILLPVVVRGGVYESEWVSNVTIGSSGEAEGFSNAATQVMGELSRFIESNPSFDIESALAEGRVKFWVVGFSRGGATANLTAKRLTDIYSDTGNDVFAYTFEAPKGGLDSEVLKESWTYEGKYLNIHNIINAGDLVPYIAPEQMGFKRYGVDHYVPGGAAGEVTEHVYTTPTGLTVTTYSDNQPYVVGDDNYVARRSEMLHQLALIDDAMIFDDYFSLATMNYMGSTFGDDPLIGKLKDGTLTAASEWIPVFVDDLLRWAANGAYSWGWVDDGGFDGDYRKFYSENKVFSGKEFVTLEESLQIFAGLVLGSAEKDELMEAMMYRFSDYASDGSNMFDFYFDIVRNWDDAAHIKQNGYYGIFWDVLNKDMKYPNGERVPKLKDFYDDDKEIKNATKTLLSFLFLFIAKDYDNKVDLDGVDTTQIHLGTLLYNMGSIFQCHHPEVALAWLRTSDSNYSKDSGHELADTSVKLVFDSSAPSPTVKQEIELDGDKSVITLEAVVEAESGVDAGSSENGSAIYYQIYKNNILALDWTLYSEPIVIDISGVDEYTVKAYAVRFKTAGETLVIDNEQVRMTENTMGAVGSLMSEGSIISITVLAVCIVASAIGLLISEKRRRAVKDE